MVFDVIPKVKRKDLVVDLSEAIFRCLFTISSGLGKMAAHLTKQAIVWSLPNTYIWASSQGRPTLFCWLDLNFVKTITSEHPDGLTSWEYLTTTIKNDIQANDGRRDPDEGRRRGKSKEDFFV